MNFLTAFDMFCLFCFVCMTILCALAGHTGFTHNPKKVDKAISLILSTAFSFGFATLSIQILQRLLL